MSLMIRTIIFISVSQFTNSQILTGVAQLTYYESFATCCPNNPNYDQNAPTTECDNYNACAYPGWFAALDGQQSFDFVQNTDIIAFFDNSDSNGNNFLSKYGGKYITLTKDGHTFTALIADTCGNTDCNNCCSQNSSPDGYLVDLEYYTAERHFGTSNTYGLINFEIDLGQTTTTTTTTSQPITGNIIIRNQGSTGQWWVAFYIENVDTSCGGSITNVEITDNNHYQGQWVSYSDNSWGYYSFNDANTWNNKITPPFTVRITISYNGATQTLMSTYGIVTLTGDTTVDFGSNFCRAQQSTTTTTSPHTTTSRPQTTTTSTAQTTTTSTPQTTITSSQQTTIINTIPSTTTDIKTCINNISIRNKDDTQEWWVAFYIENIDLSCGGMITNVEIKDNANFQNQWVSYSGNDYGFYSFNDNNKWNKQFAPSITVRITRRYNGFTQQITALNRVNFIAGATVDFGSNFCCQHSITTTTTITTTSAASSSTTSLSTTNSATELTSTTSLSSSTLECSDITIIELKGRDGRDGRLAGNVQQFCDLCYCEGNQRKCNRMEDKIYSLTAAQQQTFITECGLNCGFEYVGIKDGVDMSACDCSLFECKMQVNSNDGNRFGNVLNIVFGYVVVLFAFSSLIL